MNIELFAFGKLKQPGFQLLSNHYKTLIKKWVLFSENELKPVPLMDKSKASFSLSQKKELHFLEENLKKKKTSAHQLILLDETGKNLSSTEWAKLLESEKYIVNGTHYFALGSSVGFSEEIKKKSSLKISLGRQTLSHELARIVLYEQIFRALSIIHKHPYHHGD